MRGLDGNATSKQVFLAKPEIVSCETRQARGGTIDVEGNNFNRVSTGKPNEVVLKAPATPVTGPVTLTTPDGSVTGPTVAIQ